jgi:tRNA modification GTPase
VFDASESLAVEDREYLTALALKKRILVRNKTDLPARLELPADLSAPVVEVSCRTGQGIENLKDAILQLVWAGALRPEMTQIMINSRHQHALQRARQATQQTLESLRANRSLELVALDLQIAVSTVGEIVGKTTTEDLLDAIFSQFCLGK